MLHHPTVIPGAAHNSDTAEIIAVPAGCPVSDSHQLTIALTGTVTAGVVTVKRRAYKGERLLALTDDYGVAVAIAITTGDAVTFDGFIDQIEVTMTGFAGTGSPSWTPYWISR